MITWVANFKLFIEEVAQKIKSLRDKLDQNHTIGLANLAENSNFFTRHVVLPPQSIYRVEVGSGTFLPNLQDINYTLNATFSIYIVSTPRKIKAKIAYQLSDNSWIYSQGTPIPANYSGYIYEVSPITGWHSSLNLNGNFRLIIETDGTHSSASLLKYREVKLETGQTPSHWTIPRIYDDIDFMENFAPQKIAPYAIIEPAHDRVYEMLYTNKLTCSSNSREGIEFTIIARENLYFGGSHYNKLEIYKYNTSGNLVNVPTLPMGTIIVVKIVEHGTGWRGMIIHTHKPAGGIIG